MRVQVSGNTTDLARPFFDDITAGFSGQSRQNMAFAALADNPQLKIAGGISEPASVPEPQTFVGFALVLATVALGCFKNNLKT